MHCCNHILEICYIAEICHDVAVIADVTAIIIIGGLIDRRQPEDFDTQRSQVVQLLGDAAQIADAVMVGIQKLRG